MIIILVIFLVIYYFISEAENKKSVSEIKPSPVSSRLEKILTPDDIPFEIDKGIDLSSTTVKLSKKSIKDLSPSLPYQFSFTTTEDINVDVSIPPTSVMTSDWLLPIYIFGPDYQIPETDSTYEDNKKAFLEGANNAKTFLEEKNIDLSRIIIEWGDREIIKTRSKKWLKE